MRSTTTASLAATLALLFVSGTAIAQEHWTDGPVWECSAYRTSPGQYDTYLKWLRSHALVTNTEAKKQGLILDFKFFVQSPRDPNDWDVMTCTLYPSYGKALDFNKEDDDKFNAISAKHWQTADLDKQNQATAPRLSLRTYLGTSYSREVNLKPMN
jgi:hypothetical protein